ncbi:MAG: aminodeoxychorismate synthase component I [Bacteroidota bacterium]|nr:aminodeoxychorismate synthase component I [Bacteroidota bacterium]
MKKEVIERMNKLGRERIPFLFLIDFLFVNPIIIELEKVDCSEILYNINGLSNSKDNEIIGKKEFSFEKYPIDFEVYKKSFDKVFSNFLSGNTYLVNLTFPTPIKTNLTLKEIFYISKAKYRLLYKDSFVVFSPEIFVKITDNIISTFPMKGTIDSSVEDARAKILNDNKEFAEHSTIVDLLRNDLSILANKVFVPRFRYIEEIIGNDKSLLQVSSEIRGELSENWNERVGNLICSLLPAGSISGAPKKKTVEIILDSEIYDRGYYTGVLGIFDGHNLDSGVMIRFIENTENGMIFKSGGGITAKSDVRKEYNEMVDKVFIPKQLKIEN